MAQFWLLISQFLIRIPRVFLLAASLPAGGREVALTLFTASLGGEGRLSLAAPSDALPASLAASLQVYPSPAAELASCCDHLSLLGGGGGPLLVVSSASLSSPRFSAPSAPSAPSSSSSSSVSIGLGGGGAALLRRHVHDASTTCPRHMQAAGLGCCATRPAPPPSPG